MSVTNFSTFLAADYGQSVHDTIYKMTQVLTPSALSMRYNSFTRKITICGSSYFSKQEMANLFNQKVYTTWRPVVLDEQDSNKNRLVQLQKVKTTKPKRSQKNPSQENSFSITDWTKMSSTDPEVRKKANTAFAIYSATNSSFFS